MPVGPPVSLRQFGFAGKEAEARGTFRDNPKASAKALLIELSP
jgi:hypothetical protein